MERSAISRRDFLKASALAGAVATLGLFSQSLVGLAAGPGTGDDEVKIIPSACRQCYGRCGILGHVKNGRVIKIEGDDSVFSEGTLCPRAFAIPQMMYSPLRVLYPMKRAGEKGEGKWKRVSWDEALDDITKKYKGIIDQYGGHTIAHQYGTGRDMLQFQTINRLWLELGSTATFGVGNLCWLGSYMVSRRIYGDETQYTGWDGQNAKCIVLWCRQERSRGYYDWLTIKRAKERGVKVICVDPRYTTTASKSDVWLPIRPGSDMALVLAFLNLIIESNKYDKEFVTKWTNGPFLVHPESGMLLREKDLKEDGSADKFVVWDEKSGSHKFWDGLALNWSGDDIAPAILGTYTIGDKQYKTSFQIFHDQVKEWTPAKAAELTWLPEAKIREAAQLYIDNSPGSCFARGQKVEFSTNTSGIAHAFTIMMALAGNFDVKGGQNIKREPASFLDSMVFDILRPKGKVRQETLDNIEKYSVCPGKQKILGELGGFGAATTHAMAKGEPFQIRGYWGQTSEPIVGVEDSLEVYEGFKKLDFAVNVDIFMTPTGEMCDYILPAAYSSEVDRVEWAHSGHGWPASHTYLIRQPFHAPMGESRDDMDICFEMGRRMGVNMGWKDKYEFFNFILAPRQMTFEDFRKARAIMRPPSYKAFETGGMRRDHRPGFETPNGKFNLYSEDLKLFGHGPLPQYIEQPITPFSRPDLLPEYPYVLITGGRSHAYFHTEYRQSPWMREIHTYPTVDINTETAAKHNIKSGDWIYIETNHGKCKQRANVTNAVHPQVIHAEHDWWFPEKSAQEDLHGAFECNCNLLIANDGPYDPAVGTDNFGGLCKIYKAQDGAPKGIYTTAEQLKAFLPEGGQGK